MFSNRSVSVQPSGAADRVRRTPAALIVSAAVEEVLPGLRRLDARVLEGGDVVPDRRLVGRLEEEAVERAVDAAELHRRLAEVRLDVVSAAKSSGCSASLSTKSRIRPGCGSTAMSGGLPPSTAVESCVGSWSPAEV